MPVRQGVHGSSYSKPGDNLIKQWGEAYNPLSQLPVQVVQSNMVYQPGRYLWFLRALQNGCKELTFTP
jgi:hypothetical protein